MRETRRQFRRQTTSSPPRSSRGDGAPDQPYVVGEPNPTLRGPKQMELRQNMRRATTQPTAWVAAISIAVATGLIGWNAFATGTRTDAINVRIGSVITSYPPLDRNAERQQQAQTLRSGGPGGHIGDAP